MLAFPGELLPTRAPNPRRLLICTAGHIDHGKSSLIRALTGTHPDRLPEEQRRGITIELGFAHHSNVAGIELAIVDVPGHERFVRTMVAGAQGVDLVLMVVAMDEGVMPQTREHAEVCRLLGIAHAVVVLSRADLVELSPEAHEEWKSLLVEDIRHLGGPFSEAPVVEVSARTGAGMEALAKVIAAQEPKIRAWREAGAGDSDLPRAAPSRSDHAQPDPSRSDHVRSDHAQSELSRSVPPRLDRTRSDDSRSAYSLPDPPLPARPRSGSEKLKSGDLERKNSELEDLRPAGSAQRSSPATPDASPDAFFLPIDRAFTLKGHGTVVTGTLQGGAIRLGDEVELVVPAPREGTLYSRLRVRNLQSHGKTRSEVGAQQRVAVNLPGVEVGQVSRGSVLAPAGKGLVRSGPLLSVEIELSPLSPPLPSRAKVLLHLGSAQAVATCDLLGRASVSGGEKAVAQLRLDRAVFAARGQRFVLRSFSFLPQGGKTWGGGRVLLVDHKRRRPQDLKALQSCAGSASEALITLLNQAGTQGLSSKNLLERLGLRLEQVEAPALAAKVLALEDRLFSRRALATELSQQLESLALSQGRGAKMRQEQKATPSSPPGASSPVLPHSVPHLTSPNLGRSARKIHPAAQVWLREALEKQLEEIKRPQPEEPLSPLMRRILDALKSRELQPPTVDEFARAFQLKRGEILAALAELARRGLTVRIGGDLHLDAEVAQIFKERIVAELSQRQRLDTGEIKEIAQVSRKFLIPLCQWLDSERVTLRVGEHRVLRGAASA